MDEVAAGCVCSDNACVLYIENKDTVSWNTHNHCLEHCTDKRKVTSHSAYAATSTESDRVKIDGFLYPNFM